MKWEIVLLLVKFYLVISTRTRWPWPHRVVWSEGSVRGRFPSRVVWSADPVRGRFPSRVVYVPNQGHDECTGPVRERFPSRGVWVPNQGHDEYTGPVPGRFPPRGVWVPNQGHDEYTGPVQGNSPFPSRVDLLPRSRSPFPSVGECAKVPSFFKVAGGVKTEEYPFTAGIEGFLVQNEYNISRYRRLRVFCGGSVITNRYVLTAAHCVEDDKWKPVNIRLGDVDLRTNHHKTFPIEKIIVHEQYDREDRVRDIALVKVRQDIVFNDFIKPLCLPWNTARKSYDGEYVELAGFGATETSSSSTRKRKVELRVVDCYQSLYSHYLCAIGDHGEDSCSGDSGGSLVAKEDGIYVSVGIVSYGLTTSCGRTQTPGFYTRVSKYLDWIESKVE